MQTKRIWTVCVNSADEENRINMQICSWWGDSVVLTVHQCGVNAREHLFISVGRDQNRHKMTWSVTNNKGNAVVGENCILLQRRLDTLETDALPCVAVSGLVIRLTLGDKRQSFAPRCSSREKERGSGRAIWLCISVGSGFTKAEAEKHWRSKHISDTCGSESPADRPSVQVALFAGGFKVQRKFELVLASTSDLLP